MMFYYFIFCSDIFLLIWQPKYKGKEKKTIKPHLLLTIELDLEPTK